MKYKVLSLNPPYGTLIAILAKRNETRGQRFGHRGPLLIHQTLNPGNRMLEADLWQLCLSDPFRAPLLAAGYGNPARLPRGQIVAICELSDCRPMVENLTQYYCDPHALLISEQSDHERAFGDWRVGRYALTLSSVQALPTPIAARGMPGLWEWEGELYL